MGVAVGVGFEGQDPTAHYTVDGNTSLCGRPMQDVFRWSQYPKSILHKCDTCAGNRREMDK